MAGKKPLTHYRFVGDNGGGEQNARWFWVWRLGFSL
jgi:hypothetical protein